MRKLAPGLWVHEAALRFLGAPAGRIMTVVRLEDGGLFVHSPASLGDALRAALEALGEVRFAVAPSPIHGHVSMGEYRDAFPGVQLVAGPGLARRRKDLDFAAELGDTPDPRWASVLDQAPFRGNPLLPEVEFLHRESRTLILADVGINYGGHSPRPIRAFARAGRMYGRLRPTPMFRSTMLRRRIGRRDMARILEWDFDRVIPGHGAIVETGGKDALRREWG